MTDWAIDAHIVMQQAVRRLLGACVEYTNGRIFVPERALALACTHYRSIARRRARRITRWDTSSRPESPAPASRDELIVARAIAIQRSFANWASTEPQRNDGLWAVAPATAESICIAQRLFVAGIAREGTAIFCIAGLVRVVCRRSDGVERAARVGEAGSVAGGVGERSGARFGLKRDAEGAVRTHRSDRG